MAVPYYVNFGPRTLAPTQEFWLSWESPAFLNATVAVTAYPDTMVPGTSLNVVQTLSIDRIFASSELALTATGVPDRYKYHVGVNVKNSGSNLVGSAFVMVSANRSLVDGLASRRPLVDARLDPRSTGQHHLDRRLPGGCPGTHPSDAARGGSGSARRAGTGFRASQRGDRAGGRGY